MFIIWIGCSEYGLLTEKALNEGGETKPYSCTELEMTMSEWQKSPSQENMIIKDENGLSWFKTNFDTSSFQGTPLPDRSIEPGFDKIYRSDLTIASIPPRLMLDIQSDDGIWVYINETFVGNWGGEWQEEGCVNDDAECVESVHVDKIDITSFLQSGTNHIATRVSNPVFGSYFDLNVQCIDEEQ